EDVPTARCAGDRRSPRRRSQQRLSDPIGSERRVQPVARTERYAVACVAQLDHALLVESLEIPDHLRNQPDKLARDVSNVLLGELALRLPAKNRTLSRRAECRLELRRPKLERRLTEGCVLLLRLALQ